MKRFSETDKWKDEWFASLSVIEKVVFLFLIDNCDNAGFFEINTRVNSFLIGIKEDEYLGAIKGLNRGLIASKDGKIFWIKNFLFHQKNLPLNQENNAHRQIINIIALKQSLFKVLFTEILGANEGLISPIGIGIGKGKGGVGGKTIPTVEDFKEYFNTNGYNLDVAVRAWGGYDAAGWKDSQGNVIKNWKQKCQHVWFKPEHKTQETASLLSKFKNQDIVSHEKFYGTEEL